MPKIPSIDELFDTGHTITASHLKNFKFPFEIIAEIGGIIPYLSERLGKSYLEIKRGVFVADDAKIWSGATIIAPTIIGHGTEIRPGAFIRGNVIIGDRAVIGNSTEIKNSIIFDEAKLPHYNYVGDSIIGYRAHMGAASIASNQRLDKSEIIYKEDGKIVKSGMRKLGAMLGDYAEIGCGAVLCPGSIIGRESVVYPRAVVKGIIDERCVYDGEKIKEMKG